MCQATLKRLSNRFESCQAQKVASLLTQALRKRESINAGGKKEAATVATQKKEDRLRHGPGVFRVLRALKKGGPMPTAIHNDDSYTGVPGVHGGCFRSVSFREYL